MMHSFAAFLVCSILISLSTAVGAEPRPWSSRRSLKPRAAGSVSKLLLVSDPAEARAYAEHKSKFVASANYGSKATTLLSGISVAPMLKVGDSLADWTTRAEAAIAAGAKFLQGPNEVNQAGLSGKAMAALWLSHIEPLLQKHPGVRGISPSVSSNPSFATFFSDFIEACDGKCTIFCASAHIYGSKDRTVAASMGKISQYLSKLEAALGGNFPLCITEFGNRASGSSNKIAYVKQATKLLRANKNVVLAAAFPHLADAAFVSDADKLTDIGLAWVNAR